MDFWVDIFSLSIKTLQKGKKVPIKRTTFYFVSALEGTRNPLL
jgi:hypothetical protein